MKEINRVWLLLALWLSFGMGGSFAQPSDTAQAPRLFLPVITSDEETAELMTDLVGDDPLVADETFVEADVVMVNLGCKAGRWTSARMKHCK